MYNVPAGEYQVTVTNINFPNCYGTKTYIVEELQAPEIELVSFNNIITGGDWGALNIEVHDDTPPFSYEWSSTPLNTQDRTGLSLGDHTVTVTDDEGCRTSETYTIESCENIPIQITSTDVTPLSEEGGNDGSVEVLATIYGIQSPDIVYSWEGEGEAEGYTSTQSIHIDNLSEGDYHVTLTNSNGCSTPVTDWRPVRWCPSYHPVSGISASITHFCSLADRGSIDLNIASWSNAIPPLSYEWSKNGNFISSNQDIDERMPGTYNIEVTDYANCTTGQPNGEGEALTFTIENDLDFSPTVYDTDEGTCGYDVTCRGNDMYSVNSNALITLSNTISPSSYDGNGNLMLSNSFCSGEMICPLDQHSMGTIQGQIEALGTDNGTGNCNAIIICHFGSRDVIIGNGISYPVDCDDLGGEGGDDDTTTDCEFFDEFTYFDEETCEEVTTCGEGGVELSRELPEGIEDYDLDLVNCTRGVVCPITNEVFDTQVGEISYCHVSYADDYTIDSNGNATGIFYHDLYSVCSFDESECTLVGTETYPFENIPFEGSSEYLIELFPVDEMYSGVCSCQEARPESESDERSYKEESNNSKEGYKIFPNPFENTFTFEFISKTNQEGGYNIYNLLGEVVYSQKFNASLGRNKFSVDFDNQSSGMYIFEYIGEDNTKYTERIIHY